MEGLKVVLWFWVWVLVVSAVAVGAIALGLWLVEDVGVNTYALAGTVLFLWVSFMVWAWN